MNEVRANDSAASAELIARRWREGRGVYGLDGKPSRLARALLDALRRSLGLELHRCRSPRVFQRQT
jgi:hypothetical protein